MKTLIDDEQEIANEKARADKEAADKKRNNTIIVVLVIAIVGVCILFYIQNRQKQAASII